MGADIHAPLSLRHLLRRLKTTPEFARDVTAWKVLPARAGRYAPFPQAIDPRLVEVLRLRGIKQLYTHQAAAVSAVLEGRNVVVVTPTASGKTLCYNLPVLNTVLADPLARALYLFPTKALSQDQLTELQETVDALELNIRASTYDGDTAPTTRQKVRGAAQIVITNPDMLHQGILPQHTKWVSLFENLRYVVVDELHTYRGVFGSHVANLIRRLKRICQFYGSSPQFICCSATIANPGELAARLIEEEVAFIDDDGSPKGEKHFVLYNPVLVNRQLGIRRSSVLQARDLAGAFLAHDIQTIVFARSRLTTEVLLTYLKDWAVKEGRGAETVRGYRGGYLPLERRAIEQGLRDGSIRAVVATNALELGIDIGQLDAAVMTGYPGTIASAWQQAGRAGRRTDVSAAVLVASSTPLDQFIVSHPDYFFGRSPERGLINPDNLLILASHIRCAAFELPFRDGDAFGQFGCTEDVLRYLEEEGTLRHTAGAWYWMGETYPAQAVSLRAADMDNFVIVAQDEDEGEPRVIGEVDLFSAPMLIHDEAIYIHEGQQYHVDRLDWEGRRAYVHPVAVDYYTDANVSVNVRVLDVLEETSSGLPHGQGEVAVTAVATVFKKIKLYTHENVGWGEVRLPEQEMHTTAFWLTVPDEVVGRLREEGLWALEPIEDYGPNWAEQRARARERDGYRCRTCQAPERPDREHDVHHLRPFREFSYIPGENANYLEANALDNLVTLCHDCHVKAEASQAMQGALHGVAHLLRNVAPLYLMSDARDIGVLAETRSTFTRKPTIYIYDRVPAGIGFSEQLYRLSRELLQAALELVQACPCEAGCPSCVGPVGEVGEGAKQNAVRLLEEMIERSQPLHSNGAANVDAT